MHENDIAREIVDAAYKIHTGLGPGLLESVVRGRVIAAAACAKACSTLAPRPTTPMSAPCSKYSCGAGIRKRASAAVR